MFCSITMFGRLYQFCTKSLKVYYSMQYHLHNKCQRQTSVLMSRAIREAISSWLFQDFIIVKQICGDFGVLGITRLLDHFGSVLIPGDGKQIRVQFRCETFLLRHLLTLKHSHHFNFCLEFHDPFLLCSDGSTLINLKPVLLRPFHLPFSPYCIGRFTHPFSPCLAYLSVSDIYLSDSRPLCCLTL